jgi:hypothetical protein
MPETNLPSARQTVAERWAQQRREKLQVLCASSMDRRRSSPAALRARLQIHLHVSAGRPPVLVLLEPLALCLRLVYFSVSNGKSMTILEENAAGRVHASTYSDSPAAV